jgi:hypothetical protein
MLVEGILRVLVALVDYVREECVMPTLWQERLRMMSEFMLIGGQNLGACSRDTSMSREYEYGLCIDESSRDAHDTHRHALIVFPPHR